MRGVMLKMKIKAMNKLFAKYKVQHSEIPHYL